MRSSCLVIIVLFCLPPLFSSAQMRLQGHSERGMRGQRQESHWSFVEDFSHGIPGWASFPAAQDIGYDPSLYTARDRGRTCLVRDVVAEGQPKLRVGLVRSIRFRMMPQSRIQLQYRIDVAGRPSALRLLMAGATGKQYGVESPVSPGEHTLTLRGAALGVSAGGDNIEAIALEETVLDSPRGTHNRLILEELRIDASQSPSVAVKVPALDEPVGDSLPVAHIVVRKNAPILSFEVASEDHPVHVTLFNGEGKQAQEIPAANGTIDLGPSFLPGLWRAHISTAGATTDFRFLVLGAVPPHPRLLLTPERLEQLRSHMPSPSLSKLIQERASAAARQIAANSAAGDNILLMPAESLLPGLTQYFDLLDRYGDAIILNALDFRLRGADESLHAARGALLAAARWPTWTPPWFQAHGLQSYYEAGIFSQKAAVGYDLIADRLTEREKNDIANAFYRNAILPAVQDYFSSDRMPVADSNHMAHSLGGAIAACLAVYDDVPDWNARFGPTLAKLIAAYERLLQNMFPQDGSEAEPIDYQEFAMRGISVGAAALARAGIAPQGTDRMLKSFLWPDYAQYKPGYELDTGDEIGTLFAHSGFAWAAEVDPDPILRAFYQSAATRTVAAIFNPATTSAELPSMLDLVCCTSATTTLPSLPPSRIFPERGNAALRSGWDTDSTLVSIRVGPWINHGHHDEGSFQVASHGQILIGEAGYTSYYDDPRFNDYFTQAAGHNTVIIDHDAFSQDALASSRWKAFANYPEFTHHVVGDKIDFLEADLRPAYPDYDLTGYRRQYIFLKPDLLFVHDSIASRTPHSYSFLLHPADDIQPVANGTTTLLQKGQIGATVIAAPGMGIWHLAPAPIPVVAYTDFDKNVVHPRSIMSLETSSTRTADFSIGVKLSWPGSDEAALQPFSALNAEGFSTTDGSVHILFRKNNGELALSQYSADGDILATADTKTETRIFTADARRLRIRGQTIISAAEPIDAEMVHTAERDRWQIFCAHATAMKITASQPIKSAQIDSDLQPPAVNKHMLELSLQPGEHRVDLLY